MSVGAVAGATKTVQRVEDWLLGPDGTVYRHQELGDWVGVKIGGTAGIQSRSCAFRPFEDRDIDRPTASTHRVRVEYTVEGDFPTVRRVEIGESPVGSVLPPRPFMTGLALTSDLIGDPLTRPVNRPATFVASGIGGTPPYQYQWRLARFVVRDWSPDPTFVWDGTVPRVPLPGGVIDVEVLARSAGGSDPETRTAIGVLR